MFVCLTVVIIFSSLSATLTTCGRVAERQPFRSPAQLRLLGYSQTFSALVLFLTGMMDDRASVYAIELAYFANSTVAGDHVRTPEYLLLSGLVAANGALLLLACLRHSALPKRPRIYAGILLELMLALVLALFTGIASPVATNAAITVLSVASFVDATAATLSMVASYEIMVGAAAAEPANRALVIGMMLTVWSLANIASRVPCSYYGRPTAQQLSSAAAGESERIVLRVPPDCGPATGVQLSVSLVCGLSCRQETHGVASACGSGVGGGGGGGGKGRGTHGAPAFAASDRVVNERRAALLISSRTTILFLVIIAPNF